MEERTTDAMSSLLIPSFRPVNFALLHVCLYNYAGH